MCACIQYRSSLCCCICAWSQPVHMHAYCCSKDIQKCHQHCFPKCLSWSLGVLSIATSAYYGSKDITNIVFPAWNRELNLFPIHTSLNRMSWSKAWGLQQSVHVLCTYLLTLPLGWLCHLGQLWPDAIVLWCDINGTFPCYKAGHDLASITQYIGRIPFMPYQLCWDDMTDWQ